MNLPSTIKSQLLVQCFAFVNERIDSAKQAMNAAQDSANQEEKSSAGDKYETGRAMAQLERDKAAQQVVEAMKMQAVLSKINADLHHSKIGLGSLVITDTHRFYLSISAGKLSVNGLDFLAISTQSPIGQLLLPKSLGDSFVFNNQKQTIREVH